MLIGTIRERDNHYLVECNQENNQNVVRVIFINEREQKYLKWNEVKNLIEKIFSSALTFQEKENLYDVYLDEAGNRRYFKNGKEDFFMFFHNNGVSAIEYESIFYNPRQLMEPVERYNPKHFFIQAGKEFVVSLVISLSLVQLLEPAFQHMIDTSLHFTRDAIVKTSDASVISFERDQTFLESLSYVFQESGDEPFSMQPLTVEMAEKYINSSTVLTEEEKKMIANKDLLTDVLALSDSYRNYTLRKKLKSIDVSSFDPLEYEKEHGHRVGGYYSPLERNHIHMSNHLDSTEDPKNYYNTFIHEYVHLLQDDNKYFYVREACAEIISNEYFREEPTPITSYTNEVKRVRVLMEIIGPDPIMECNFSSESTLMEDSIGQYLQEEEKEEFLSLLETHSSEMCDEIDQKVDQYLAKMYHAKTGKNIEEDLLIQQIYQEDSEYFTRIYFNKNHKYYDYDKQITTYEPFARDDYDLLNSNEVLAGIVYTDYNKFNLKENVKLDVSSDEKKYFVYEGNSYTLDEAIQKQYLIPRTPFPVLPSLEEEQKSVPTTFPTDEIKALEFYLKDGSMIIVPYEKEREAFGPIFGHRIHVTLEPSIPKKFGLNSSQNEEDYELIEMLDDSLQLNEENEEDKKSQY